LASSDLLFALAVLFAAAFADGTFFPSERDSFGATCVFEPGLAVCADSDPAADRAVAAFDLEGESVAAAFFLAMTNLLKTFAA
jgi:hypothetical protein